MWFQRKIFSFSCISHYKLGTDNDAPRRGARGTICRIHKENYYTLLVAKYKNSRPCDFRDDSSFYVYNLSIWEVMTPARTRGNDGQDL